jgi:FlaA1/EpsC-like NDP-sugar epimerase
LTIAANVCRNKYSMPKQVISPSMYRLGQLSLDGFVAWFACSLAFVIRFDGDVADTHQALAWILPLVAIPGRLLIQSGFGLYQQVWRLFGLKDAISLFHAVTLYSLFVLVVTRVIIPYFQPLLGIPLGVSVIDWSLCLLGMVTLRYIRRWSIRSHKLVRPYRNRQSERQRVLLVGAGMAGCLIVQEARQNPQLNLEIVGFVDDDRTKVGA